MTCLNNAAVLGCYNGTPVVLHYTYDNSGQPQVRITDLAGAVIPAATSANTVLGECVASQKLLTIGGVNIAGGTYATDFAPGGTGSTWTPATVVQAFTVTALRGTGLPNGTDHVKVTNTATNTVIHMLLGETRTWSVQQDVSGNEALNNQFTVECLGNSAAGIHYVI